MEELQELAIYAAQQAGRTIRAAWLQGGTEVRYKGRFNPVTEVDLESQRLIREILLGRYPDHDFWGEEGPKAARGSDFVWIVDPLDGTKNFAHGYPHFCVSVALEANGQVILGVVHDPIRQETFTARRGKGALLNGQPISVSPTESLERALLVTGFGAAARIDYEVFLSLEVPTEGVRRDGSAALNLAYVACGRLDGQFQLNLWPWDAAAGTLLVEEAGGMVTDYGGGRFELRGRELVASNVKLHRPMLECIRPHLELIRDSICAESWSTRPAPQPGSCNAWPGP